MSTAHQDRQRIAQARQALRRLSTGAWLGRGELFDKSQKKAKWVGIFIARLLELGVVEVHGVNFHRKYRLAPSTDKRKLLADATDDQKLSALIWPPAPGDSPFAGIGEARTPKALLLPPIDEFLGMGPEPELTYPELITAWGETDSLFEKTRIENALWNTLGAKERFEHRGQPAFIRARIPEATRTQPRQYIYNTTRSPALWDRIQSGELSVTEVVALCRAARSHTDDTEQVLLESVSEMFPVAAADAQEPIINEEEPTPDDDIDPVMLKLFYDHELMTERLDRLEQSMSECLGILREFKS